MIACFCSTGGGSDLATSVEASSSQLCACSEARCLASGESVTSLLAFHHSDANAICLLASSKARLYSTLLRVQVNLH